MTYPNLDDYQIKDASQIYSPGLVIFREFLEHNIAEMIRVAGGPERLRPHCKTHKTREIIELKLAHGITKHKCATIAEAEMLADVGVEDILLAYQMVGPNIERFVKLVDKFPDSRFIILVDHPSAVTELSQTLTQDGRSRPPVAAMLDLNPGMNRTGIRPGQNAIELYEMILSADGLTVGGLHWYDGHHRQPDIDERTALVNAGWDQLVRFRDQLLLSGLEVPRIVTAGTGSFPILAEQVEPNLELSPGTTVYHDDDMATRFPEMNFVPALGVLTRVISRNRTGHLTLDIGHKACGADQPAGHRVAFPQLPDANELMHSEEHLVIETAQADQFKLGDALIAIPRHACPTSAVFQFASVVSKGQFQEQWKIASRDRVLTI